MNRAALEHIVRAAAMISGDDELIVLSPHEVNVDASGPLIEALTSRYPGGWSGGDLPARGFWGRPDVPADIVEFVSAFLRSIATQP